MLLKPCDALPRGDDWRYELKFDGFRGLAIKNGADVRLFSRNGKSLTAKFPPIIEALKTLHARSAIIDGEIVCLDHAGRPCFEDLQNYGGAKQGNLFFYAFDLLALDNKNLAAEPIESRKSRLRALLADAPPQLRLSDFLHTDPTTLIAFAREHRLEGIVAKRLGSRYEPGQRTGAWRKFKTYQQADFLIGGYLPGPNGAPEALCVGQLHEGALIYAARVEVYLKGLPRFTWRESSSVNSALKTQHSELGFSLPPSAIRLAASPFLNVPLKKSRSDSWSVGLTPEDHARMIWLSPTQTVQVRFTEQTRSGLLRHAGLVRLTRSSCLTHGFPIDKVHLRQ